MLPSDLDNPETSALGLDAAALEGKTIAENVARNEIGCGVHPVDTGPPTNRGSDLASVFERRLDEDVDVAREPVWHVGLHGDPADDDVSRSFFVERSEEIGKVPAHRASRRDSEARSQPR
jgi:hypothetical protein